MLLTELAEFDVMALKDLEEPYDAVDWSQYPEGVARSPRGLEILSYDLVGQAYRSPDLRNSTVAKMEAIGFSEGPVYDALTGMTTSVEGTEHKRMRRAFQSWFVTDNVEKFRAEIRGYIDTWMRQNSSGVVDFGGELGNSLPAFLFTQIVGADPADSPFVSRVSGEILQFPSFNPAVHDTVERAVMDTLAWLDGLIEQKLSHPGDDLTSALLEAERDGTITRDHTRRILITLIIASTESTRAQMSCNLVTLAKEKDQWQILKRRPDADLVTAVQELYRYNPATLATSRSSETDIEFHGIRIEAFEPVFLNRFTANNDPSVFATPRELDVLKVRERPAFTFGNGRHSCVGRVIATIEMEELLASALEHWEDFDVAELEWTGFPFIRSPLELKFAVTGR